MREEEYLGQEARATADIEEAKAGEGLRCERRKTEPLGEACAEVGHPLGIHAVEWLHLSLGVPPPQPRALRQPLHFLLVHRRAARGHVLLLRAAVNGGCTTHRWE